MRVVSGICKGKMLRAVPGNSTRPTTDKVKEAMFNIIGPYFQGGLCLDLFAGSGALGIEALSRGIEKTIFVDHDKKAINTIRENVYACQLEKQAEIFRNDAFRAMKAIIKRNLCFDLIFLDPPYRKQEIKSLIEMIDLHRLLKTGGAIICEHIKEVSLPEKVGDLVMNKHETYGIMSITIYKHMGDG